MAVDGPKGPLHRVKPGVFEFSRLADAKIVPVGVAIRAPLFFKNHGIRPNCQNLLRVWSFIFAEPAARSEPRPTMSKGPELSPRALAHEISKVLPARHGTPTIKVFAYHEGAFMRRLYSCSAYLLGLRRGRKFWQPLAAPKSPPKNSTASWRKFASRP